MTETLTQHAGAYLHILDCRDKFSTPLISIIRSGQHAVAHFGGKVTSLMYACDNLFFSCCPIKIVVKFYCLLLMLCLKTSLNYNSCDCFIRCLLILAFGVII